MLGLNILMLAVLAVAAPTEKRWFGSHHHGAGFNWWAGQSSSYIDFGSRFRGRDDGGVGSCDLSKAVMPTGKPNNPSPPPTTIQKLTHDPPAPTALPTPAPGLTLAHVAIGRGTQNYTCDLSNSTAVPVAVGAVATLFNVSCLAADLPDLLSKLAPIALDLPVPNSGDTSSPIYQSMSGHHYFTDMTTPFFNMDTSLHEYGTGAFRKVNSSSAPPDAVKGQGGEGMGAVAWLKLDAKGDDGQVFQEVFRVNTAGGSPPKTCEGQQEAIEVQYAAEYWLFQKG